MDVRTEPHNLSNAPNKGYISLPPEVDLPDPEAFLSAKFVIFAIIVISAAAVGGSVQSGRISLNRFFPAKAAVQAPAASAVPAAPGAPAAHAAPAAVAVPVAALNPDAVVVTSISIGQPSFAIINGTSRVVGDAVEAPGVTGWKVKQIVDGAVLLQNGATVTSVPLSTPGIKPLDDTLHSLN
jgi:hypothetical protein